MAAAHFERILGMSVVRGHSINLVELGLPVLSTSRLEGLLGEADIWQVIWLLPTDKAPWPDDFMARFYSTCWPTIRVVVMRAEHAFDGTDDRGFERLNVAFITLLPKCDGVRDI